MAIDFSIINRRFLVASCDVVGAEVDIDELVLVVTVDTEKLEVHAPSPSAIDAGSDVAVITTGA